MSGDHFEPAAQRSKGRRRPVVGVGLGLMLLALVLTNPSKGEYVDWAQDAAYQQVSGGWAKGAVALFGGPVLKAATVRQNYVLFSLFQTDLGGDNPKLVLGLFRTFIPLDQWLPSAAAAQ